MPFLDADAIVSSTFVRHVDLHDSLSSTNDRAIELAATPELATPSLVATRLQTAGRGRGTNAWWAGEGALTFSLILDTAAFQVLPRDWPRLSLTTAVAICDALAEASPHDALMIKWPNDVLIRGRKVCGILIESPQRTARSSSRLIVGVGINVNNSRQGAPAEIRETSIALCDVAGRQCDIQQVLVRFLESFERRIGQLANDDSALADRWGNLSALTHATVTVQSGNESIEGVCLGIGDDGALLLECPSGTARLLSGTVRIVAD